MKYEWNKNEVTLLMQRVITLENRNKKPTPTAFQELKERVGVLEDARKVQIKMNAVQGDINEMTSDRLALAKSGTPKESWLSKWLNR